MKHSFKPSRLVGLFALLAGFMAFSATVAQAEPGAYWEVGGVQIKDKKLLPKINARKDSPHIIFLTHVGASNVEILCTEIKFVNGLLHELGRFTGKIHLEGCITKINGVTANACKPKTPGAPLGLVETEQLEGLLKLHLLSKEPLIDDDVLEILPVNVAMIFFRLELGEECALGNNINDTGTLFLKDCENRLLENRVEHLLEEFKPLTKLFSGVNAMTIDGSFWTFLEGEHKGQLWSGHPA